jgi:hypothetical protein
LPKGRWQWVWNGQLREVGQREDGHRILVIGVKAVNVVETSEHELDDICLRIVRQSLIVDAGFEDRVSLVVFGPSTLAI